MKKIVVILLVAISMSSCASLTHRYQDYYRVYNQVDMERGAIVSILFGVAATLFVQHTYDGTFKF